MQRCLLVCLAVCALCFERTASAQLTEVLAPEEEKTPEPPPPTTQKPVADAQDFPVRRKSYVFPALEILTMNLSLGLAAQLAGADWAQVSFESMKRNLTTSWKLDSDPYSINNLGHPYFGAMYFSAARSTGHNWWVSGLYAFGGSAFWETFMETETPSINDQLTTPIGGMFIGEMMHRASRALLHPGYGKPGRFRRFGAAVIDPVGEINRQSFGDPWAKTVPPNMYAHFGLGVRQPTTVVGEHGGDTQVHAEAFVEHGLTGDRAFQPKHPLDHFELRAAIDSNTDDLDYTLNVRGLLVGKGGWTPRIRGMGGLFGAYDFDNHEYVRASMLGVGPGGTAEVTIGRYGYVEGTAAAYLVPWGAGGGVSEREKLGRDYHRGPGLGQLLELKAGRRGIASVRLTNRAYQIAARLAGDDTNEVIIRSALAAEVHVAKHHAIGVEGGYGWRRATSSDAFMEEQTAFDRAAEVRAFYAITTDEILGR